MLIDYLKSDSVLQKYICQNCSENGIEVQIDARIEPNNILIIKVDDYYNTEVIKPDCSPDCLIVQRCLEHFDLYIVELRNVKGPRGINIKEIEEKFITCLDDFMSNRFAHYFHHSNVEINIIKLYFITDPYGFKTTPQKQLYMKGHKLDFLMSIRIPKFFGKFLYIEHHIPNPTILKCI